MRLTPHAPTALALLLVAGAAEAQTLKIGYINSQEILLNTPGAAEAQQQFDADVQRYQDEIEQLQLELEGMQQQLDQQQLTLSPEARANREQQIRLKAQEAQQRSAELSDMANRRRAELVQPVMDRINTVIEALRTEGNYALILDLAAGSIIAADPTLDLTQEVIRRLEAAADTAASGGR